MVKRIYLPRNLFKIVTAISTIRLMITMLAPVGRFISNDRISLPRKQITDRKTDNTATALKLTTSLRAITAGKMIKLEIKKASHHPHTHNNGQCCQAAQSKTDKTRL